MYSIFSADEKTKNGPCFLFPVICRRIFFSEKKRNNQNKVALKSSVLVAKKKVIIFTLVPFAVWEAEEELVYVLLFALYRVSEISAKPSQISGKYMKGGKCKKCAIFLSLLFVENVRNSSRLGFSERFSNVRHFLLNYSYSQLNKILCIS